MSILRSGLDVWRALLNSGLAPTRATGQAGYDECIKEELNERLFAGSHESIEANLAANVVSTENFLEAFFATVQPFSVMLRDALAMFEAASAQRGDRELKIAFNLDNASKELAITLQHFRQFEKQVRRVTRPVLFRQWNTNSLSHLTNAVRSSIKPWNIAEIDRSFDAVASLRDVRLAQWIVNSGRPGWLDFPGFTRSGDPRLDRALHLAEDLIRTMLTEVRKLGRTYREFEQRLRELPWDEPEGASDFDNPSSHFDLYERPKRQFIQIAHDFWPNSFARLLGLALQHITILRDDPRTYAIRIVTEVLEFEFGRQPVLARTITELERSFLEFLNLPIWKKRHELYSVWVASQIAAGLSHLQWEWHPDGDALRFPFSGAHLATLRSAAGTYQFWTEMRSEMPKKGVKGRRNIQPDYRIVEAPVHRKDATALVVECKQYMTPSTSNFSAALDDYALGCPAAQVVLVNYGRADNDILQLVPDERRNRAHLTGEFRPGNLKSINEFKDVLQKVFPLGKIEAKPTEAIDIQLQWGEEFGDLDLHVKILPSDESMPPVWINYQNRGSSGQEPWTWLDADVRTSGAGDETIRIERPLDANYLIFVHDYSNSGYFPRGQVTVRVHLLPGDPPKIIEPTRTGRQGRWWLAGVVCGAERICASVDIAYDDPL